MYTKSADNLKVSIHVGVVRSMLPPRTPGGADGVRPLGPYAKTPCRAGELVNAETAVQGGNSATALFCGFLGAPAYPSSFLLTF